MYTVEIGGHKDINLIPSSIPIYSNFTTSGLGCHNYRIQEDSFPSLERERGRGGTEREREEGT